MGLVDIKIKISTLVEVPIYQLIEKTYISCKYVCESGVELRKVRTKLCYESQMSLYICYGQNSHITIEENYEKYLEDVRF